MINSVNNQGNYKQSFGMAFQKSLASAAIDACGGNADHLTMVKEMAEKASGHKYYDIGLDAPFSKNNVNAINIFKKGTKSSVLPKSIKTDGNINFLVGLNEAVDKAGQLDRKAQSILDLSV